MLLKKIYCRVFQACFGLGARVLPWRRPECITGAGSLQRLPELLADAGCKKPMIVASRRQCAAPEFITMAERLPARSSFHGVTAETGLDALTHAVEAYIGRFYNTRETRSLAWQVVEAIYRMNRALGIPEYFSCIRSEDLPQMAAWEEANPAYPVPVIFGKEDFIRVARRVMP